MKSNQATTFGFELTLSSYKYPPSCLKIPSCFFNSPQPTSSSSTTTTLQAFILSSSIVSSSPTHTQQHYPRGQCASPSNLDNHSTSASTLPPIYSDTTSPPLSTQTDTYPHNGVPQGQSHLPPPRLPRAHHLGHQHPYWLRVHLQRQG